MLDNRWDGWENRYYGSFWHFDGRKELPSAVAHTGDGVDSSDLPFTRSRWDIQFPEYLFDAYFIESKDQSAHQYDWCFFNMGELEVTEPGGLSWNDYDTFLEYWPTSQGAGERTIASKPAGRIVGDWRVTNGPWVANGDETLLRNPPQHSGRLRLIMPDDSPSDLIKAEIGYYEEWYGGQSLANSQDILAVRKTQSSCAFIDTLEPIADDEEAYVNNVSVVEVGNHQQRLVKVTTSEGEDWIYLSGEWNSRPDGETPVAGVATDGDILVWRVVGETVRRVYIANGSYGDTPHGSWSFGFSGNHYLADTDGDRIWDHEDNCPFHYNPDQGDFDNDGTGDPCDMDDDNDGYADSDELTDGQSDPLDANSTPADNDGDFLSDLNDPDDDNDGLPDENELSIGTDPFVADSDGDAIGDAAEAAYLGLEDFDCPLDARKWLLFGGASHDAANGWVVLTPDTYGRDGSIFYTYPFRTTRFLVEFDVYCGEHEGGDGIVFAFVRQPGVGRGGGWLGFLSGLDGYGVEFDTYNTWDGPTPGPESENHVGISRAEPEGPGEALTIKDLRHDLENDTWFHAEVLFDRGRLQMWMENDSIGWERTRVIDYTVNSWEDYEAYFGFTAATGGACNLHAVDNFGIVEAISAELVDTDGDGIIDALDTDSDNDGLSDDEEDANDNGTWDEGSETDWRDPDTDGDGYTDGDERTENQSDPLDPGSIPADNDSDKVSDLNDPDDDNDGYSDSDELTQNQSDPLDAGSVPPDNDNDRTSDLNDPDDDNDGVLDVSDAFPFDPTEYVDTDGDGIGNNADPDDDGDGYTDTDEQTLNQSDPLNADSRPPDNDLDMVSDLNDYDDDNDGMPDSWEEAFEGLDPKSDDAKEDLDDDGQDNYSEYVAETDPTDPDSVFAAVDLLIETGQFSVSWSSVPGRFYRVLYSPDLVNWGLISGQIPAGLGGQTSWSQLITAVELKGFYKIEVVQ